MHTTTIFAQTHTSERTLSPTGLLNITGCTNVRSLKSAVLIFAVYGPKFTKLVCMRRKDNSLQRTIFRLTIFCFFSRRYSRWSCELCPKFRMNAQVFNTQHLSLWNCNFCATFTNCACNQQKVVYLIDADVAEYQISSDFMTSNICVASILRHFALYYAEKSAICEAKNSERKIINHSQRWGLLTWLTWTAESVADKPSNTGTGVVSRCVGAVSIWTTASVIHSTLINICITTYIDSTF